MTVKPDFFIVGAPKCGTTAMNDYLAEHPQIFMAKKEIHYFGADLQFTQFANRPASVDAYLRAFAAWHGEQRVGEASVYYLFSRTAAQEIHDFNREAQIIIMLRNPVDMLYSNYHQMRFNGNEDLPTFEEALAAAADRRQGRRLPATLRHHGSLQYRDTARFTEQVQRYLTTFGRDQVHIIIFDDFVADTATVYRDTLAFLRVDTGFALTFDVVNPNKTTRSATLRNLYSASSGGGSLIREAVRTLLPAPMRKRINRRLNRWNTRYTQREPMSPETRRMLQVEFLPEVERLSALLNRDLTHWCQP